MVSHAEAKKRMARWLIWTEQALHDLDAIADYIALDKPLAARRLVQDVLRHVGWSTGVLPVGQAGVSPADYNS